jgi:hypothetical protein
MKKIFTAEVVNGKLQINNQMLWDKMLYNLSGTVQVTIDKRRRARSMPQNKYYWGVVIKVLLDFMGDVEPGADEELRNYLCSQFLIDRSRKIPRVLSTSSLSTKEFEDYLEKIRVWSAKELQVFIPLPGEIEL